MVNWLRSEKGRRGPFEGAVPALAWREWENTGRNSIRISCRLAEIL